jgi:hypothetical protein
MNVGIIGAGGMSQFHAREFFNSGTEVVSILDIDKEKGDKLAKFIFDNFKFKAKVHTNITDFLNEDLQIVSICTPPEFHAEYLLKCINQKIHVFCEKPFIFENLDNNYPSAKKIIDLASLKDKISTVNTQWPAIFNYLEIKHSEVKKFEMYMEPGVKEIGMLKEHLAHMNSMLIRLIPEGKAGKIKFIDKEDEKMTIEFIYKNKNNFCKTRFRLNYKEDRPRAVEFSINGKKFFRKVGENYSQSICYENNEIKIEDPFKISIQKFVEAVRNKDTSRLLISNKEILDNIKLQDEIIKEYLN